MIRQEQGKRNRHKEEVLISSSQIACSDLPLALCCGVPLLHPEPPQSPLDLIGKNPVFACWQLPNMP